MNECDFVGSVEIESVCGRKFQGNQAILSANNRHATESFTKAFTTRMTSISELADSLAKVNEQASFCPQIQLSSSLDSIKLSQ